MTMQNSNSHTPQQSNRENTPGPKEDARKPFVPPKLTHEEKLTRLTGGIGTFTVTES